MTPFQVLLAFLAAMSLVTFVHFAWDKSRAQRGKPRIPERVLLTWSVAGGAAGGLLAMLVCRHKIRTTSFWILHAAAMGLWTRVVWVF